MKMRFYTQVTDWKNATTLDFINEDMNARMKSIRLDGKNAINSRLEVEAVLSALAQYIAIGGEYIGHKRSDVSKYLD